MIPTFDTIRSLTSCDDADVTIISLPIAPGLPCAKEPWLFLAAVAEGSHTDYTDLHIPDGPPTGSHSEQPQSGGK